MVKNFLLCLVLLGLPILAFSSSIDDYIKSKKVIVDTSKAELCFIDDKQCYPVLIGVTTPKGVFNLRLMKTNKSGYKGEVIGFKEDKDFLFALHRVWLGKPSEHRMERIKSLSIAERVMTNGCINVTDDVYEKLRYYFILEVV